MPGQVGRVDGGRFEISFAIQSDGLGVNSAEENCSRGAGSALRLGLRALVFDSDDLKLSSVRAGIELRC